MKNKMLTIILIILIILFISVIYIVVNNNINKDNNTLISEDRLKQLFDNSYKYYLLYEGKEEENDTSTELELEGVKYSKVNIFNTIDEVSDMINNTFTEKRQNNLYNAIFEKRNYVQFGQKLYVEYDDYCNNIEINYNDISITETEDNIISINCGNVIVHAYYENNNWYLDAPLHFCE